MKGLSADRPGDRNRPSGRARLPLSGLPHAVPEGGAWPESHRILKRTLKNRGRTGTQPGLVHGRQVPARSCGGARASIGPELVPTCVSTHFVRALLYPVLDALAALQPRTPVFRQADRGIFDGQVRRTYVPIPLASSLAARGAADDPPLWNRAGCQAIRAGQPNFRSGLPETKTASRAGHKAAKFTAGQIIRVDRPRPGFSGIFAQVAENKRLTFSRRFSSPILLPRVRRCWRPRSAASGHARAKGPKRDDATGPRQQKGGRS